MACVDPSAFASSCGRTPTAVMGSAWLRANHEHLGNWNMLRDKTRGGTVPPHTSEECRCLVVVIPGASTREGAKTAPSVTRAETPDWRGLLAHLGGAHARARAAGEGASRGPTAAPVIPRSDFLVAHSYPRRRKEPRESGVSSPDTREGKRPSFIFVQVQDTKLRESHRCSASRPLNLRSPPPRRQAHR